MISIDKHMCVCVKRTYHVQHVAITLNFPRTFMNLQAKFTFNILPLLSCRHKVDTIL